MIERKEGTINQSAGEIYSRTPQLVGNFEALRFIEAEEKRKNKAEKGKRREKLEKRKTDLQPPFSGCKLWAFFTIKLGKMPKMQYICP